MEIELPVHWDAHNGFFVDAENIELLPSEVETALNAPVDCDFTQYVEQKREAQLQAMRVLLNHDCRDKQWCWPEYTDEQLLALLEESEG